MAMLPFQFFRSMLAYLLEEVDTSLPLPLEDV